jgi:hypothetical protein
MTEESQNERGFILVDSVMDVIKMNQKQRKILVDQVSIKQPCLMHEITPGLSNQGVPQEKIDKVIEILLILSEYFSNRGKTELPLITEKIIKETKANYNAFLEWQDREDPEDYGRLFEKALLSYPDTLALGFLIGHMKMYGFYDKTYEGAYCIMISKIILDSFIKVLKNSY